MGATIQAATAAEAVGQWWAEQVGAPRFQNVRPEERSWESDFVSVTAHMLADKHPVTPEAGRGFAQALQRRVEEDLKRPGWTHLGVDYGPDPMLAEAAEEAGVSMSRFPWKTSMWVHRDYVTVSTGYGAPIRLVWNAQDWKRPACGSNRYDGDFFDEVCPKPRYHEGECGDWVPDTKRCSRCGGTYAAHYGKHNDAARDRCLWTHDPATEYTE